MIQPHAVDDDEEDLLPILDPGRHKLGNDIHRQQGRAFLFVNPAGIIAFHEFAEFQIADPAKIIVHSAQARVLVFVQLQIPLRHAHVQIDPVLPVVGLREHIPDAVGCRGIAHTHPILLYLARIKLFLARHQDLARVDWFGQIVIDALADGVFHQPFFLVFCNHDDGNIRVDIFDGRKGRQTISAGHHFVEQHNIETVPFDHFNGIISVGHGRDLIPALAEKHGVRAQQVYFVICP